MTALVPAADVIAQARCWLGTPYLHQGTAMGLGCDCLGLVRGIWRHFCGAEPYAVPPYTRDWGEAGAREVLFDAASRVMVQIDVATGLVTPGALVLFRMSPDVPAKHCGVVTGSTLIHAYERGGVIEEPLSKAWQRRAAYAFQFPAEFVAEV